MRYEMYTNTKLLTMQRLPRFDYIFHFRTLCCHGLIYNLRLHAVFVSSFSKSDGKQPRPSCTFACRASQAPDSHSF